MSRSCPSQLMLSVAAIALAACASPTINTSTSDANSCTAKFGDTSGVATGLDLSVYQDQIDWQTVAKQDRHFVFIRAGHGTKKDTRFDQHWTNASDQCVLRGAYFFFNHTQDVERQAALFSSLAKSAEGELPPVIDIERINANDGTRICSSRAAAKEFVSKLDTLLTKFSTGFKTQPIIYTSSGFWNCLPAETIASKTDLWVAHYTTAPAPRLANGWDNWRFWQFTDSAHVGDITVDSDRFNGSPAALLAYSQSRSAAGAN